MRLGEGRVWESHAGSALSEPAGFKVCRAPGVPYARVVTGSGGEPVPVSGGERPGELPAGDGRATESADDGATGCSAEQAISVPGRDGLLDSGGGSAAGGTYAGTAASERCGKFGGFEQVLVFVLLFVIFGWG